MEQYVVVGSVMPIGKELQLLSCVECGALVPETEQGSDRPAHKDRHSAWHAKLNARLAAVHDTSASRLADIDLAARFGDFEG